MVQNEAALTDRQRQIKDMLDAGKQARAIGEELGISRNAVYQTITRLKKLGVLREGFTASGAPSRSNGEHTPARLASERMIEGVRHAPDSSQPLAAQLLIEIADVQQELARLANRLARWL